MRKLFVLLMISLQVFPAYSQLFTENFDRPNNVIVGNDWVELESPTGIQIVANQLKMQHTDPGREFAYRDVSSLYNTNGITNNNGLIQWAFNFKQTNTEPTGFDASKYAMAFVLGKTTGPITTGNGYAVIYGQSSTSDYLALASFTGGLNADNKFSNIIAGNVDLGNQFISVRVTYNTITDEWSLFAEANQFAFPQINPVLTATRIGVPTVNTTYTGVNSDLKYMGAFWNHGTTGAHYAIFDDISISMLPVPYYPRTTATDLSQPSQWTTDATGAAGISPADFTSPNQLFHLNDNISAPMVSGSWTLSGGSNLLLNNTNPLVFASSSSFTIGIGSVADFNNKPVVLKSDASGTARFGAVNGTLTNASNVTVERFISSANKKAYRLLAPSVMTTTSIHSNWQEGGASIPGYGTHITGNTSGSNGFDNTPTGTGSLLTYNSGTSTWEYIANTDATSLDARKGYLLHVKGDRTIDLSSPASPGNNTVLRATGSLLTGEQTYSALAGNGAFSLVANPYAAPINWASVHNASTGLSQFYTCWDPNIGADGGYVTVSTSGLSSHAGISGATQYIQPGQAFFVQAAADIPSAEMKVLEEHKADQSSGAMFRTGSQSEAFTASLFYTDQLGNRVAADAVTTVYNNSYSTAIDGNDALQMRNWSEDIAIARATNELSIESRPLIDVADDIPLVVSGLKVQSYEWQFTATDFNHPDLQASLVDNFLGTRTPIALNGTTAIAFTVTSDPASTAANRFVVEFGPNSVLPVRMGAVKAYQKGDGILVEWKSGDEAKITRYEIERSANMEQFRKVGTVAAKGEKDIVTYQWMDAQPEKGSNFYRIKAVDNAGEVQYSDVVRVNLSRTADVVSIYPNPVVGSVVNVSINLPKGRYVLNITNKIGQQVYRKEIVHQGGVATESLQLDGNLPKGTYQLSVGDGGTSYVQQLIRY